MSLGYLQAGEVTMAPTDINPMSEALELHQGCSKPCTNTIFGHGFIPASWKS